MSFRCSIRAGGAVVHARRGERDRHPPPRSILCEGNAPDAVMAGPRALLPLRRVYIADLYAIEGTDDQSAWPPCCRSISATASSVRGPCWSGPIRGRRGSAMTLARVGGGAWLDIDRLAAPRRPGHGALRRGRGARRW